LTAEKKLIKRIKSMSNEIFLWCSLQFSCLIF
jgi:hypothetical protein